VIRLEKDAAEGGNIRRRGEEIAAGDTVLQVGRILRQADIMLLAALGYAQIDVRRKLRVAVLSSGDELLEQAVAIDARTADMHLSGRPRRFADCSGAGTSSLIFSKSGISVSPDQSM